MTDFSFQLYSARNFPPLSALLPRLAALGYRQVEGFSGSYANPEELAGLLKANGLTMPTGHFAIEDLKDSAKAIRIARTLGIETLICPAIPMTQRGQGELGWAKVGEMLAGFAAIYQDAGFAFAWHNHDFEFVPAASGKLPMDILLELAPSMSWEADVAWMIKAKQAPFDWFDRYGPRITAIHVKDIALPGEALDEDGWADVGYGTIDWPSLFAEIKAHTAARYFVMEHDNPSDVDRFASRSIAAAKAWK